VFVVACLDSSHLRFGGNINRTYIWLIILSVVMVPYGYWVFVVLSNFSVAFWMQRIKTAEAYRLRERYN
jgi:hypothetical protein